MGVQCMLLINCDVVCQEYLSSRNKEVVYLYPYKYSSSDNVILKLDISIENFEDKEHDTKLVELKINSMSFKWLIEQI